MPLRSFIQIICRIAAGSREGVMGYEPVVNCRVCDEPLDVFQDHENRFCESCGSVLDQWEAGEIGLVEAFETLTDWGADPVDACETLKARNPEDYREQDERHNAELAGMA
jgi:hypothetical protein